MIIKLETTIQYTSSGIDSSSFSVTTTKEGLTTSEQRTINKAYVSDEKGNSITQNSNYITLELSCHPSSSITNPFYYNSTKSLNNWANPYTSSITLTKSLQNIDNGGMTIDNTPKKRYLKGVDNLFTIDQSYTHNSITLKYAHIINLQVHQIEELLSGFMELEKVELIQQFVFMEIKLLIL